MYLRTTTTTGFRHIIKRDSHKQKHHNKVTLEKTVLKLSPGSN